MMASVVGSHFVAQLVEAQALEQIWYIFESLVQSTLQGLATPSTLLLSNRNAESLTVADLLRAVQSERLTKMLSSIFRYRQAFRS